MTEKLYHRDPYRIEFTAQVVSQRQNGDGLWEVELDATALYPTSGGQPYDDGFLQGQPVIEVIEEGDTIIHLLENPLPEDERIRGKVCWVRRFDHMQQHAGQHILSQACLQVARAETVGFHLSDNSVTIDLDVPQLTTGQIQRIEDLANQIVTENRRIVVHVFPTADEIDLPIRKSGKAESDVRVIEVEGFDYSPCGGTHPRSTGEIGLIKILKTEKVRGNTRVHFACGQRALEDYRFKSEIIDEVTGYMTIGAEDLPDMVRHWDDQIKTLKKQVKEFTSSLLKYEAEAIVAAADSDGVYLLSYPERGVEELRQLAAGIVGLDSAAVVLAGVASPKPFVLVVAGEDSGIDASQVLRECGQDYGWKGGGTARQAQGRAEAESLEEGLQAARRYIIGQQR